MTTRNESPREHITLGERVATALVSAIAAVLPLVGHFVISVAFTSRSSYGPPKLLFDVFASKVSIGLVIAASLAGFILGSSRMANVFADLWGTSERRSNTAWIELVIVVLIIVVAVAVITYLAHGG